MNTKNIIMFIVCVIMINFADQLYAQQTITGFEAPESVLKVGDKLFVSNIGGTQPNPTALDSNGFISELSLDGKMIEKNYSKTILNGPKGLTVAGSILYTADINRVVGLDVNSGEQVFELSIADAQLLNDLCKVDESHLVVSESMSGKIYLINLNDKSYNFIGNIPGANGVTYDAATKKLYACGMGAGSASKGSLFEKDINGKDTVFTALPNSPAGIFDGLEMTDNDHLLVTDWVSFTGNKGRFVMYNLKDHSNKEYSVEAGPADVYYDKATKIFYLPQMLKNDVLIENIGSLK